MHPFKLATFSSAAILMCSLPVTGALAGTEACRLLTAEKFGEITGYKVKTNVSTETTCTYKGTGDEGGMLMIVTTKATPQTIAMVNGQGSSPQGRGGKLGGTFSEGTVVFTVGISGTDPSKVTALAAEVRRNLK